jgi:hypothetical protein
MFLILTDAMGAMQAQKIIVIFRFVLEVHHQLAPVCSLSPFQVLKKQHRDGHLRLSVRSNTEKMARDEVVKPACICETRKIATTSHPF